MTLPCPFCGSKDIALASRHEPTVFFYRCHSCGAQGPTSSRYKDATERRWNKRVQAPALIRHKDSTEPKMK